MRICLPLILPAFVLLSLATPPGCLGQTTAGSGFTRLIPVPASVVASAEAYPGGQYDPKNLADGITSTEYASNGKGTNTFVDFDLGRPTRVVAFQHIDRNDPATVAASELSFSDGTNKPVATFNIAHAKQRSGNTLFILSDPVTAQRAHWRVTELGANLSTVGGADVMFFTVGSTDAAPTAVTMRARAVQLLKYESGALVQPIALTLEYPYLEPLEATIETDGTEPKPVHLSTGKQTMELPVPAVSAEKPLQLRLKAAGQILAAHTLSQSPVRKFEIFLLPHSHVDIGYTELQADVAKKQNSNIETGIRLAQASGDYPAGARFKWNVEVLWPVENYLHDVTPEKREEFISAVRSGQIGLDAFYGNMLTGLCRPEELLNLMGYAQRLQEVCGVPIESAMISDVPGYTWSTVSAMAQAGVKYFSFAPNYFDRMGATMKEWQNRPFWWKGPDGRNRVLCWCPSRGYALGHLIGDGEALARFIPNYLTELETNSYPYDITYLRWNVHGDNGSPDEKLADVVRDWNTRYIYPHLIISTTAEAFRAFEYRYGGQLPEFSGDYTPYWEDGAGSSALESAMNRASGERLVQAQTLWAMRSPGPYPAEAFQAAWRDLLLYSEHTWGAHNSISQPDLPFVRDQWKVKQGFAFAGDAASRRLLAAAGAYSSSSCNAPPGTSAQQSPGEIPNGSLQAADSTALDVLNTSSWSRTDVVTVPAELSAQGDRVVNVLGIAVLSQRLSSGELAFLAKDVPGFGSKRFWIQSGTCKLAGVARAEPPRLISSDFFVRVNAKTGGISHLFSRLLGRELVATNSLTALNDFFYLPGSDLTALQSNGTPNISIKENGPLIASLLIESAAPGCKMLRREVRVFDGLDRVEMINTIDKLPIRSKEGLHFGYAFAVPQGVMRMDVGWGAVRPELDQIPAACKNWFSVQRWVDISNDRFGVTWSPMDAPLVEVGGITANLVGSQTDPRAWIQHLQPSQTLYSWVMNNHWHTNYRADQEGPTVFRYAIRAHRRFEPEQAAKFGAGFSQPLIVAPASAISPAKPRLQVSGQGVLVTTFKPADDARGWIIRLFGASGKPQHATLRWSDPVPRQIWLSELREKPIKVVGESIDVPAWGIVTLRAE